MNWGLELAVAVTVGAVGAIAVVLTMRIVRDARRFETCTPRGRMRS